MPTLETYFLECETLSAELGRLLGQKNMTVSCVESCTGGLIASFITSISGSSAYFNQSWVTYSNLAKQTLVGVLPTTLECFGAVSEEVAKEMVHGCLLKSSSTIALSITGIAGPTGGTPLKPVGMVCFGLGITSFEAGQQKRLEDPRVEIITETQQFDGSRTEIRFKATLHALKILLREIEKIS